MKQGRLPAAHAALQSALRADASNADAHFNLATVLRRLGRQAEAVALTWDHIERSSAAAAGAAAGAAAEAAGAAGAVAFVRPVWAGAHQDGGGGGGGGGGGNRVGASPAADEPLTVVMVKWGTKYGPEYVNKLARGVCKHLPVQPTIVCFTDDGAGVDAALVQCRPLPEASVDGGWKGWWNKVLAVQCVEVMRGSGAWRVPRR
jgi:hypothetical protein